MLRGASMIALLIVPLPALAQDNVLATATLPRDLSPWGMYLNADPVVKAVLIGLAFASIVTWTVWLAKTIEIVLAKRRVRAALNKLVHVRSTAEGVERLADAQGEVRQFLEAAVTTSLEADEAGHCISVYSAGAMPFLASKCPMKRASFAVTV